VYEDPHFFTEKDIGSLPSQFMDNLEGIVLAVVVVSIFEYSFRHWVSDYSIRKADLTIVTNEYLRGVVESKGGRAFILEDRVPEFVCGDLPKLSGKVNVVCVCSYSWDEPIDEMLKAAESLPKTWAVYVTGQYEKWRKTSDWKTAPENIHFTGFLHNEDYERLLLACDIVVVLTTQEHTLTCGAYEAIAAGKPMVLSSTQTIKDYFTQGAIYAHPVSASIGSSIETAVAQKRELRIGVKAQRRRMAGDWEEKKGKLMKKLTELKK